MSDTLSDTAAEVSAILVEQAGRLFAQEITPERLKEADAGLWPQALWTAVEEAGLPLALVPEAAGGVGLDGRVAGEILRLSARHALPLPLAETMVGGALWAAAGGTPGEGPLTFAAGELTLAPGLRVAGRLRHVPWGAAAGRVLAVAREGGGGPRRLVLVRPGAPARSQRNLANEPRDSFDLDGLALPAEAVKDLPPALDDPDGLGLFGAFVRAQQMAGAMGRALDSALAYANERKQFGRPIGKFQAVQHMLAEAAGLYAACEASARSAAAAWGTPAFALTAALAKARTGEAAGKVAEIAHQVHGAMGFTQEHPLHFVTRRLWSWRDEFGHEAHWQERIGRKVLAEGGEALWPMLVALRNAGRGAAAS